MKNIKILLLITLVFTLSIGPAYAADDIKVTIDGNEISFDTKPERSGKTIMVPMKEFFEAMGARILWVESQRLVVAYKDNTHMKLQLGTSLAYRNGNKFTLESEPYLSDGRTLVPIQIIAETFNLMPIWDEETSTLSLIGSEEDAGLKLFDDGIYKTKPINELGITISIPYHWENLDGPFQYGYQDDFESYSITLMSQTVDKDISLEDLVNENKALLLDAYDEDITFTGEESIKIDNILDVKKLYITTTLEEKKQKQVLYILKQNDKAYFMTCHYAEEVPEEDIIEVFDNVVSTFKIRNLSVDTEEEHYMEFENFYYTGVQLNQEYYSNMVVEKSEIPFSGTLEEGHGLDAFKVRVTSDKESLDFIIPIAGNAFDGTIYTPFGLGKHNIFISGVPSVTREDEAHSTDEPSSAESVDASEEESSDQSSGNSLDENQEERSDENTDQQNELPSEKAAEDNDIETFDGASDGDLDVSSDDTTFEVSEETSEDPTKESGEGSDQESIDSTETDSSINDDDTTPNEADNTTSPDSDVRTDLDTETEPADPVDEVIEASREVSAAKETAAQAEVPLMQFSVINIDSRTMRYRIPTNIINSSDVQINSTSMLITYQVSNEYMKARELYYWMLKNIAIDTENGLEKSNIQVFDDAVGTPEQINQLYVAYLRAIDVPARVMKGTANDEAYYWSELFLNGSWVASDLIDAIRIKNDESIQNAQSALFNINMKVFRDRFDLIQIMPY